jgi:superfamily I DNA/RNA helicase/RecB family exonuclease
VPVTIQLRLPEQEPQISLSDQQQLALGADSGVQLLLGAAGSGRSATALMAAQLAVAKVGLADVWVISASRTGASQFREKLISINPATTPRVFTISALAYAMLRTQAIHASAGEVNLKMLTGPQQEARIREILANSATNWPAKWKSALNTKVFASDLRRWIDINRATKQWHPDPALAKPLKDFVNILLTQAAAATELSYTEANLNATELLNSDEFVATKHFSPKAIIVDDLHDFDQSQLDLLVALVKQTSYCFVTSNADAAVLSFRGVGIETTKRFRDAVSPTVHTLDMVYRYGQPIGSLVKEFLPTLVSPDLNELEAKKIRDPKFAQPDTGKVEFEVAASEAIRDALIVDRIMQAKVNHKLEYNEIAIIGRSFSTLTNLRRSLAEAAIPVEFSPDNVALAKDPAVSQLLQALVTASKFPNQVTTQEIVQFALSEIVGMNPAMLRRTAQELRTAGYFGSTQEVIASAIKDPNLLAALPFSPTLQPLRRAAAIMLSLVKTIKTSNSVAEVLWGIWQARVLTEVASQLGYDADERWLNWPARLQFAATNQSAAGRKADRDLDAVLSLFDAADRADRNYQGTQSLLDFIAELTNQDAASEVLIQRSVSGVAVLTAHRARGREWKLVIIVDLQEGIWPANNVRESIIQARDAAGQRQRLAEERRLAAAAAATAQDELVICVIDSKLDQGTAPSSLLVNFDLPNRITATPPSMLTIRGLIARLRATSIDDGASPELRAAAINRLGYLAKLDDPRTLPARPENWWFVADVSESDRSIVNHDKQLAISGSMLDSVTKCPTQWFFERKLKVQDQPVANTVIGLTIHSIAQQIVNTKLELTEAINQLTKLWPSEIFDAQWQSEVQLVEAKNMVTALHAWIQTQSATAIGTELKFKVVHADLDVVLVGHIDLLQQTSTGSFEVVDYKTGSTKPTKAELQEHSQLGIYQLAVSNSEELNPNQAPVSAKLVQIRLRNSKEQAVEQAAPDLADDSWLVNQIQKAKTHLISEDLPARPGAQCRNCKVKTVCPAVPEGDQVAG